MKFDMVALVLVSLFVFFGVIIPAVVGIASGALNGPSQDCYQVSTSWGKDYFTANYNVNGDNVLHVYDLFHKPGILFWDFEWNLVQEERTFPFGSYVVSEWGGR